MKKYLKLITLLFVSLATQAQKSEVDLQTRTSVSLNLNLKKGWQIGTEYRVKFNENSSNYRGSYLYLEVDKKLNKYLSAGVAYRFGSVEGDNFHRFSGNIEGKYKFDKFTFSLRETYQSQKQTFIGDDEGTAENYLRTRLGVKYAITKKLDFGISTEPFMHKNDGVFETDFWRNRAGLSYEYMKNKSVNLYYIWQPDVNKKYPDTKNIIGINFIFGIKTK
ncbi:hypothetical protein EMA8858_02039 [Emticicia aquatica]|uniref:DUF2490 domain-containing protein n=1 Tax=Emticicia aquatica TaxID=1681835 RepID=A0ABM9AR09_9BACT|nr:DUF2490 domain-containing protein [Emticicia aquatica]CAH0995911.1 hypothetical protein EMA8858_02039 [Emticicia aquatica]